MRAACVGVGNVFNQSIDSSINLTPKHSQRHTQTNVYLTSGHPVTQSILHKKLTIPSILTINPSGWKLMLLKNYGDLARWLGCLECCPVHQVCGLDSQIGHVPRLWIQSLVSVCTGGNQSMCLSLFSSVSQINKHNPGWGLKQNNRLNKI